MAGNSHKTEKKIFAVALIGLFLFLVAVESHVHNHSLWQGENDSCPAYILSFTVNADSIPHVDLNQALCLFTEILPTDSEQRPTQDTYFPFHRRGPPIS